MDKNKSSLVLASHNSGKIKEFSALFAAFNTKLVAQSEYGIRDIEELGLTFVENAIAKARHATRLSGLPALADDSGLVVPALNGSPGIYSARYAGPKATSAENIQKLLHQLDGFEDQERLAFFHCTLVLMTHEFDPMPLICQANWEGRILSAPTGTAGFGYDPVFYVPSHGMSAAELPQEIKNTLSHRAMAIQKLKMAL